MDFYLSMVSKGNSLLLFLNLPHHHFTKHVIFHTQLFSFKIPPKKVKLDQVVLKVVIFSSNVNNRIEHGRAFYI